MTKQTDRRNTVPIAPPLVQSAKKGQSNRCVKYQWHITVRDRGIVTTGRDDL